MVDLIVSPVSATINAQIAQPIMITNSPGSAFPIRTIRCMNFVTSKAIAMSKPPNVKAIPQGLIYTMISRAKSSSGLKIINFNANHIKVNKCALEEMQRMQGSALLKLTKPVSLVQGQMGLRFACLNIRSLDCHLEDLKLDSQIEWQRMQ